MRLTMQPVLPNLHRAKTGAWRRVLGATIAAALFSMGVVWTPRAEAQNDNGGLSSQSPAPVMITPAPSNPSANTPLEPIFPQSPQSNTPAVPGAARSRDAVPLGPSLGAGLGYGPIRAGDIVEVQIFDAPEYSVRMPVSS